ncbi:piggyBac transposable element-derived protein 4-like [Vespula squamosa]|uniref:PiggyBac transposable element-derived protein 4-like n=1 Tax=Vespula squamosa TaxID=30214 RepID=A0ABD2BL50_VESSQ
MLKKCYDGEFFHEHITGDKIIGKTSNILGTIRNNRREFPKLAKSAKDELKLLYKSNNCTLTIHKSKPINKITIIINTKHKSVQINNDRKRLPETVITKLNSASMSPVKWQESTASNQDHIDGPCKIEENGFEINYITNQCTITNDKEIIVITYSVRNLLKLQTNHESSHGTWHRNAYSHGTEN